MIQGLLNQTATVLRHGGTSSPTRNTLGEIDTSVAPVAVAVERCSIQRARQLRPSYRDDGGTVDLPQINGFHPPETVIRGGDFLDVGGKRYGVSTIQDPTGHGHHKESVLFDTVDTA